MQRLAAGLPVSGITCLDGHRDMVRYFVNGRSVPAEKQKPLSLCSPRSHRVGIEPRKQKLKGFRIYCLTVRAFDKHNRRLIAIFHKLLLGVLLPKLPPALIQ